MSGSFLARPWPPDLPSSCPQCGRPFDARLNLTIGPGRQRRRFAKALYWGMMIWSIISWPLLLIMIHVLGPGQGLGLAMVAYFLLPVILLCPFLLALPHSRRVRCFKCSFDRDYRLAKGHAIPGISPPA